jgi:hypothetical protein
MLFNFILWLLLVLVLFEVNYAVILAEQVSHLPPCCYHPQLSDKGSSGELILLDSMIVYIYTQNLVSKDKFSCYNVILLFVQVPPGTPVVNALSKQRAMLENITRACVGLAPENNMILEYKWSRGYDVKKKTFSVSFGLLTYVE